MKGPVKARPRSNPFQNENRSAGKDGDEHAAKVAEDMRRWTPGLKGPSSQTTRGDVVRTYDERAERFVLCALMADEIARSA